jgi:hypothetical protein
MKSLVWLCAGLLLAAGASAQVRYTCRSAGGTAYLSDRPCSGSEGMVYYGPSQSQQGYPTPTYRTGEAPPFLKYMSPRCSGLNDALRTGPARGLKAETLGEMRRDYQRDCQEDESEARSRLGRETQEERKQRVAERQAQAQAQERTKLQEQQCGESKRILFLKKQRSDLSEGERADLKRFEDAYRARCG